MAYVAKAANFGFNLEQAPRLIRVVYVNPSERVCVCVYEYFAAMLNRNCVSGVIIFLLRVIKLKREWIENGKKKVRKKNYLKQL
jgi:hypothetical protein